MQRDKIELLNELTDEQTALIEQLREEEFCFLAAAIEISWKDGRSVYIDQRVPVSQELRFQFEKLNIQFRD